CSKPPLPRLCFRICSQRRCSAVPDPLLTRVPSLAVPPGDPIDYPAAARLLNAITSADPADDSPNDDAHNTEADLPQVPGYRVDRLLGVGGGGHVYLAYRAGSDMPVTLKALRAAASDATGAERAWREL